MDRKIKSTVLNSILRAKAEAKQMNKNRGQILKVNKKE